MKATMKNEFPWSDLVRRIEAEGHGDHTQSVIRYRALQESVNRYCDPETFRKVMGCYESILSQKL